MNNLILIAGIVGQVVPLFFILKIIAARINN
jgi:hypothetical protein